MSKIFRAVGGAFHSKQVVNRSNANCKAAEVHRDSALPQTFKGIYSRNLAHHIHFAEVGKKIQKTNSLQGRGGNDETIIRWSSQNSRVNCWQKSGKPI